MKKRLITSFILIIMLIALSTVSNATDIASVTLSADDTANKGDAINVSIVVKGTQSGVQGIQGTLNYDSNVLEYVSNSNEKDGWKVTGYNDTTGIFLAEITNVTDSGCFVYDIDKVVSFTFKVKDNISVQKTNIVLSNIIAVGANNLASTEVNKTITIKEETDKSDNNTNNDGANNSTNSNSNNNSNNTTNIKNDDPTVSKVIIPKTGRKNIVTIFIITNIFLCIAFYFGYKKYKDI